LLLAAIIWPLTPEEIIKELKQGNERFRSGRPNSHDYVTQRQASAGGQCPVAAIAGCIDSRAPAEILSMRASVVASTHV
jgi:carbonic anhydrase